MQEGLVESTTDCHRVVRWTQQQLPPLPSPKPFNEPPHPDRDRRVWQTPSRQTKQTPRGVTEDHSMLYGGNQTVVVTCPCTQTQYQWCASGGTLPPSQLLLPPLPPLPVARGRACCLPCHPSVVARQREHLVWRGDDQRVALVAASHGRIPVGSQPQDRTGQGAVAGCSWQRRHVCKAATTIPQAQPALPL